MTISVIIILITIIIIITITFIVIILIIVITIIMDCICAFYAGLQVSGRGCREPGFGSRPELPINPATHNLSPKDLPKAVFGFTEKVELQSCRGPT